VSVLSGKRVLVTGGTGFIGGRVVEKLVLEHDARVRVLTSNYANASRVARFDIELVQGNVNDRAIVREASEGCDTIIHCAYGSRGSDAQRRAVTVEGTRAVLDAALAERIRRVVHVSTMVVYGVAIEGRLDEKAAKRRTGVGYGDDKLEAENLALSYVQMHGLPVSVIQPTAVYGPFAPSWTERVIESLKTWRVPMINGGTGLANPVYIDDVADAMLLAATRDEAVGEAFLIASGERVTWREFYSAYEAMLGFESTIDQSLAEAKAHYARSQKKRWLAAELLAMLKDDKTFRSRVLKSREAAALARIVKATPALRRLVRPSAASVSSAGATPKASENPVRPIRPLHPQHAEFLAAKTDVAIDKARRLLGFNPAFDLKDGMRLTEAWLAWAGLVPAKTSEAP
jgi:nucleoside-diphosphate-sugar epimerase